MFYGSSLAEMEQAAAVIAWHEGHFAWQDHDYTGCELELESPPRASIVRRILGQPARAVA